MDPDSRHKEKKDFSTAKYDYLLKNIWQVSTNAIVIAIINLAFQIMMSRALGPEQYGELQTLLTINTAVLFALSAVCFIVTRFVSYYKTRQQYDKMKYLAYWSFMFFFLVGFAAFAVNIIMSNIIASFLNMQDYTIIIVFGLLIWISFLMPIIEGILRGLQEFRYVSKYKTLDASMILLVGVILLFTGINVKELLVGIVLAGAVTMIIAGLMLKKVYINKPYWINVKEIYKFAIPVFISCVIFALLANIDMIFVRHYFSATMTGYYAAAGILAKILLIVSFGTAGVMFPKIVEQFSDGKTKEIISTLRSTLKIFVAAGFLLTLAIAAFPDAISHLVFGSQYTIGTMLSIYVMSTFFLSIVAVLMMYDLAVKKFQFIPVFVMAIIIEIFQITKLHSTLYDIVWTLFVINILLLGFMIYYNKKALFASFG